MKRSWPFSIWGSASSVTLPSVRLRDALLWRLMVLVVGVLVLASVLILVLGILPMSQRQAATSFEAAHGRVKTALDHIQATSRYTLVAGQRWWALQSPRVDDPKGFNEFFMPILHASALATSVVAGTTEGEGWLLLQLPHGHWRNRLTDVPRWGQDQRILRHDSTGRIDTETVSQDYDPRLRPWYKAATGLTSADDIAWTAPYTLLTTGDSGITASIRLFNVQQQPIGVLGLDLMLKDVSQTTWLADAGGEKGLVFVITQDERVLALPKPPDRVDSAQWLRLLLRPASALEMPEVDAAIERWWTGHGQAYQVESLYIAGQRWLASASPYQLGQERLWIFTLAPAAYFSPNWGVLLLGLFSMVVVLSGLAWWLAQVQAHRIVKPLEELAQQSERIGQLDFAPAPQPLYFTAPPVYEIGRLSHAYEQMRELLQHHQTELDIRIAALENAQQEIHQLAFYDALTQLPNRRLLLSRLTQALHHSQISHQPGAVLFIDLDNFKALNDTLGHSAGDEFLQHIAHRLLARTPTDGMVARLGGDEFLMLLENLSSTRDEASPHQQVNQVAQRLLQELGQAVRIKNIEHICTPSMGMVLFYGHERAEDVLKWADMAMYQAKAAGRNGMRFFDPLFQIIAEHKAQLETDLRLALRQGQLQMWLQPQFDRQRQIVGAEALLRWPHPTRGWISPADFIPIAESSGLIVPLGQWVLAQACGLLQQWATEVRTAHWTLSVNVSARQFKDPHFVPDVLNLLVQTKVNASLLRLELTESMLLDEVQQVIERMDVLRQEGIGFSLDDFGTGYSSLAYLKRLPFVELKIDKSFVRDIMTDASDAVLTQTMIVLAHGLGLKVLAEGVETEGQFTTLCHTGCDLFQGYLMGKPMTVNEFASRSAKISSWYD